MSERKQHEAIDHDQTPRVNFVSSGPSSLDCFVYTVSKTVVRAGYHQIKEEIMLNILRIIRDNGADVAFPARTLHVGPLEPEPDA